MEAVTGQHPIWLMEFRETLNSALKVPEDYMLNNFAGPHHLRLQPCIRTYYILQSSQILILHKRALQDQLLP
jgi:hypothetical protein